MASIRSGKTRLWLLSALTVLALAVQAEDASAVKTWQQLSAQEKTALAPLADRWNELTEIQRGKWQQVARQFHQLPAADQIVLQERMSDWVALSPTQRNRARLNFNVLQSLSTEEKRTRWDEYQALSEDRKKALSASTLTPARTAAPSPKPQQSGTLIQPNLRSLPEQARKIPADIDPHTLLPRRNNSTASQSASEATAAATAPGK